jgi:hypothetical protein
MGPFLQDVIGSVLSFAPISGVVEGGSVSCSWVISNLTIQSHLHPNCKSEVLEKSTFETWGRLSRWAWDRLSASAQDVDALRSALSTVDNAVRSLADGHTPSGYRGHNQLELSAATRHAVDEAKLRSARYLLISLGSGSLSERSGPTLICRPEVSFGVVGGTRGVYPETASSASFGPRVDTTSPIQTSLREQRKQLRRLENEVGRQARRSIRRSESAFTGQLRSVSTVDDAIRVCQSLEEIYESAVRELGDYKAKWVYGLPGAGIDLV